MRYWMPAQAAESVLKSVRRSVLPWRFVNIHGMLSPRSVQLRKRFQWTRL